MQLGSSTRRGSGQQETHYPRRFPKIGTAYQHRDIPDVLDAYSSSRLEPIPETYTDYEQTSSALSTMYDSGYETTAKLVAEEDREIHHKVDQEFEREISEWSRQIRQWAGKRSNDNLELPNPKRRISLHDSFVESHEGNQDQAMLSLLSAYSHKHAKWALDRRKRNESMDWRESIRSAMTLTSGDYRSSGYQTTTTAWNGDIPTCNAAAKYAEACLTAIKTKKRTLRLSDLSRFLEMVVCLHLGEEGNEVMEDLAEYLFESRQLRASLFDLWGEEGVDVDVIRKQVENAEKKSLLLIDELPEMNRQSQIVWDWQKKLENAYSEFSTTDENDERDDVSRLEELRELANSHGFRSKGLVELEQKLERAYALRSRIEAWKAGPMETVKFVSAIVRDVHRLKMRSPVISEFLTFHQKASDWVDRANIAIRSRISLDEIHDLIQIGKTLPLDLSEYLEKLQSRVEMSDEWLHDFTEALGISDISEKTKIISKIRSELAGEGNYAYLQELATDGSTIPVEVDSINILHVELDAHAWTAKAKKWLPDYEGSKAGKLEELHDHILKGSALRDRLPLSDKEKSEWILECESEISSIVEAADTWLGENQALLNGEDDSSYSIEQLRRIVDEGAAIYVNLGSNSAKMSKMLTQAEGWHEEYQPLLVRCGIGAIAPPSARVQISEVKKAMDEARERVALNLEEVNELDALVDRIDDWYHSCALVLGEKKLSKGKGPVLTIDSVGELIRKAESLPVDTASYVARLKTHCQMVREWQASTTESLQDILVGFQALRGVVTNAYGEPSSYVRDKSGDSVALEDVSSGCAAFSESDRMDIDESASCRLNSGDNNSQGDMSESTPQSDTDVTTLTLFSDGQCAVQELVASFCASSKFTCLETPERSAALQLETVTRWCMKSIRYLENTRDIFDKRFYGAFDRFLKEGRLLANKAVASTEDTNELAIVERVALEWKKLVSDQLERLGRLFEDRNDFITLCKNADKLMNSEDKRPPIEKLRSLTSRSLEFPEACETVTKLRTVTKDAEAWIEEAKIALSAKDKMSLQEACALFNRGEQLWFVSPELKMFRDGIKAAKTWSKKAKRCKVHHSEADNAKIEALAAEHDGLIVKMPAELSKLQQAMKNYCICQRPYEGFMIGCDECDDWFHGTCVGVSEARVDKVSTYLCIRCSIKKSYSMSASSIANVIRKWTCLDDLKKARNADTQKFKRRFRKETKDIEVLQKQEAALRRQLEIILLLEKRKAGSQQDHATNVNSLTTTAGGQTKLHSSPQVQPSADSNDANRTETNTEASSRESEPHGEVPNAGTATATEVNSLSVSGKQEAQPSPVDTQTSIASSTVPLSFCDDNEAINQAISPTTVDSGLQGKAEHSQPNGDRGHDVVASVSRESLSPAVAAVLSDNLLPVDANNAGSGPSVTESTNASYTDSLAVTLTAEEVELMRAYLAMDPSHAKEAVVSQIRELQKSMEAAQQRVSTLTQQAVELREKEDHEDSLAEQLRKWVIRLRSLVLTPPTKEMAIAGKPNENGALSAVMISVLDDAKSLGLDDFKDVKSVERHLKCLTWCLKAFEMFSTKPKSTNVTQLLDEANALRVPYEKTTRALKSMSQRGASWENKVSKALNPVPGMKKPYSMKILKDLAKAGEGIPLQLQYEDRLTNVIDDGGDRYCLCGGPNDGRFMIGCECGLWYHGGCVGVAKDKSEELGNWKCPRCEGSHKSEAFSFNVDAFHEQYDVESSSDDGENDDDSAADSGEELWPPFGLFGSEKAQKALGDVCCAIPDSVAFAESPSVSDSSPATDVYGTSAPPNAQDSNTQIQEKAIVNTATSGSVNAVNESNTSVAVVSEYASTSASSMMNGRVESSEDMAMSREADSGAEGRGEHALTLKSTTNAQMATNKRENGGMMPNHVKYSKSLVDNRVNESSALSLYEDEDDDSLMREAALKKTSLPPPINTGPQDDPMDTSS